MLTCRLLPHETGDGPTNMATDEAILDLVASHPETIIVRTYDWSVPTLSLGYFQSIAEVAADPRWAGHPVVRRPTGGGALWHDREVTYAVAIPARHPLARPSSALYQAIHAAIAAQLTWSGVPATRRGPSPTGVATHADRPFLCFGDRDADDVVVDQIKLVGSAQRRRSGAVLQHGSLLLARSPMTPELPGLLELAEDLDPQPALDYDVTRWSRILRSILPIVLGGTLTEEKLSSADRDHADLIRTQVYEQSAWTNRR